MEKWVDFAKKEKAFALTMSDRGDINPTVIVERDGQVKTVIIAPEMDKEMAFAAAQICKVGFDPDALIIIMDAHCTSEPAKEGQTIEEAAKEFRKKYPPGSMQKMCDEEGACELGKITDCLICHRIERDGKISLVNLPYSYHGKDGPAFKWLDQEEKYKDFGAIEDGDATKLQGYVPDTIRAIMANETLNKDDQKIFQMLKDVEGFSEERTRFHLGRAAMSVLAMKKYIVGDFYSADHPEWTMAKDISQEMLRKLVADGILPKEAFEPFNELLPLIGTNEFVEKLTALLTENSYWLPAAGRKNPGVFAQEFANVCLSPAVPFMSDLGEEKGNSGPKRVKVWNGDRSEYLGEGNYVGDVTVHFIVMPDGSLQSSANPEVEPVLVPDGGKVVTSDRNPKIVLDSGDTVYGCQVWWEPTDSKPPEKPQSQQKKKSRFGGHNPAKN